MIFVSKGYFHSKNCLREARCSIEKSKPLALMHDPVRGGAKLKTIIEEECPDEMRDHIFTNAQREMIIYHRIKDFQLVTMRILAQQTLAECPDFKGKHASASHADVARKKLSFEEPITVYASVHNPGANLAMKALQAGFQDSQSRKRMSVQAGAGDAAPERRRSSKKAGLQQIRMTDEP